MTISRLIPQMLLGAVVCAGLMSAPAFAQEMDISDLMDDQGNVFLSVADPGIGPQGPPPGLMPMIAAMPPEGPPGTFDVFVGGPGHGPGGPGPGMCGGGGCPLEGPLALTDDQYAKMYSLKEDMLDKVTPKMAQMSIVHRHLKDALMADSIDGKAVHDLQNQLNSLHTDISSIRLDNKIAMASVLTADQRKALRVSMEKRAVSGGHRGHHRGWGMMHHHMGPGGPGGPGGHHE